MVDETNSIRVNGEHKRVRRGLPISQLIEDMGMVKATVERNAEPVTDFGQCVQDGDDYEIFEQL